MINLDNVSSLQIGGQAVTELAINGVVVWSATSWTEPTQTGDTLIITQVFGATQNGDILEVE